MTREEQMWQAVEQEHGKISRREALIALTAMEWSDKTMIDKACEWLDIYFMEIGYPDDWMRDSPNIESGKERFRKAMEK